MAENNTRKRRMNLLQKFGMLLIAIGIIVTITGFILQFSEVASMSMSFNWFEEPKSYMSVISTGFIFIIVGICFNIFSAIVAAKNVGTDSSINNVVSMSAKTQETHERMRQPEETYCDYCGTLLHEHERECPNCGANKTKK